MPLLHKWQIKLHDHDDDDDDDVILTGNDGKTIIIPCLYRADLPRRELLLLLLLPLPSPSLLPRSARHIKRTAISTESYNVNAVETWLSGVTMTRHWARCAAGSEMIFETENCVGVQTAPPSRSLTPEQLRTIRSVAYYCFHPRESSIRTATLAHIALDRASGGLILCRLLVQWQTIVTPTLAPKTRAWPSRECAYWTECTNRLLACLYIA